MIIEEPIPLESPDQAFESLNTVLSVIKTQWRSEKREKSRIEMIVPVTVQLLDEHRRAVGKTFQAITKDISLGGLCVICQHFDEASFALVRFENASHDSPLQLLIEICHQTEIGPFTLVGGSYYVDWASNL